MNRSHWNLVAYLTLFLVLYLVVARSSESAEPVRSAPVIPGGPLDWRPEGDGVGQMPVLSAIDPEEARRLTHFPADSDRPAVREREAVLPNPSNGRELVDRVVAQDTQEWQIAVQTTPASSRQRFYNLRRAASNFVLPIAGGM